MRREKLTRAAFLFTLIKKSDNVRSFVFSNSLSLTCFLPLSAPKYCKEFVVSTFKEVSVFRKFLLPSLLLNSLFLPQLAVEDIDYISAFRVSLPLLNKIKTTESSYESSLLR